MKDKFDELAKGLAQSVTRREALKQSAAGLAGIALAFMGLPKNARAAKGAECIHWLCRGHDRNSDWIDVYQCGSGRPHRPNQTCDRIGVVACG